MDVLDAENSADATLVWARAIRGVGQKFQSADSFRRVLRNYCISIRRGFKFTKNEKGRVTVKCSVAGCGWRIHASQHKADQTFAIRTCTLEHTCGSNNLQGRQHPKADATWVANHIREKLRADMKYKPNAAIDEVHEAFGVEISYKVAWNAREIAMKEINGADANAFDRIRWFCNALKASNPGSAAELEVWPESMKFRRVFIAIAACVQGFKEGCRPMLFLDGAFIKSKWKGCLLSAVGKDANGGFITVAYAVVNAENDDNWEWFCMQLRATVMGGDENHEWDKYTFFSDRHSGLLKAVAGVFQGSKHAICLRHLLDNFRTQVLRKYPFKNKEYWVGVLNKAGYAPTIAEFKEHLNTILTALPLSKDFLLNSDPSRWANSMFDGIRWGVINNNLAESWNAWVKDVRAMAPYTMVDSIRLLIMKMNNDKREMGERMGSVLCTEPSKIVDDNHIASGRLHIERASVSMFEVRDAGNAYAVDVEHRTCSCGYWQLLRLPCKHACGCIDTLHGDLYDYCDPYYKVDSYRNTYRFPMFPIPQVGAGAAEMDNPDFVFTPDVRAQPGRRRTRRILSQVRTSNVRCSLCKRTGHKRPTCWESRET